MNHGLARCGSLALIVALAAAHAVADCVWIGGSHGYWSDASNWEGGAKPSSGGVTVRFDTAGDFTNDISGVVLTGLQFLGSGMTRLSGNKLTTKKSSATTVTNSCPFELACDVDVAYNSRFTFWPNADASFTGAFTLGDHGNIFLLGGKQREHAGRVDFWGPVTGGFNSRIRNGWGKTSSQTHFHEPVSVSRFEPAGSAYYNASPVILYKPSEMHKDQYTGYYIGYSRLYAYGENVFDPEVPLMWQDYYNEEAYTSSYNFFGHDQRICAIMSTETKSTKSNRYVPVDALTSDAPMTLHICGATNAVTHAIVRGAVSLALEMPVVYTQSFWSAQHETTGSIAVDSGTFQIAGTSTFARVSSVRVGANGVLDVATTAPGASLASTKSLVVANGGRFRVSDGTPQPFASLPTVHIDTGAVLEVPTGCTLSVGAVFLDGACLEPGPYTTANASWISGGGTVLSSPAADGAWWRSAQDGNWATASAWMPSVPTARQNVTIDVGASTPKQYTVTLSSGAATVSNLVVASRNGAVPVLAVEAPLEISGGRVLIEGGARLEVGAAGGLWYSGDGVASSADDVTFDVSGGSTLKISANTTFTNFTGRLRVDGTSSATSRVSITGGDVRFLSAVKNHGMYIGRYGVLEATSGVLMLKHSSGDHRFLAQDGGTIDFSGDAEMWPNRTLSPVLSTGRSVFRGDAKFLFSPNSDSRALFGPTSAGEENAAVISFEGSAYIGCSSNPRYASLWIDGHVEGGLVRLTLASDATHSVGHFFAGTSVGKSHIDVRAGSVRVAENGACLSGFAHEYAGSTGLARSDVTLRVDGGVFSVDGAVVEGNAGNAVGGLWIGDGVVNSKGEPECKGKLELVSGAVTNIAGPVVVGSGRGSGQVVQTGGDFIVEEIGTSALPMVVGFADGRGGYILSNGLVRVGRDVYVGGIPAADMGCSFAEPSYTLRHDATGTLSVAAADLSRECEFAVVGDVVVGADGAGTLDLGPGGTLRAENLVLSNQTSSIARFTIDDTGFGRVVLSGALVTAPGAKIVIDARGYTGRTSRRVVTSASSSGLSGDVDVEVLGNGEVRVSPCGIIFYRIGTVMLLR